jgi:multiple sugar transport system permease protein
LAPALVILGVFSLFPLLYTIVVSLFHWRIRPGSFVGLAHYFEIFGGLRLLVGLLILTTLLVASLTLGPRFKKRGRWIFRVFTLGIGAGLFFFLGQVWSLGDARFLRSLEVTVWFALGTVPVQLVLGLSLALALNARFRGKTTLRTLLLVPYVLPLVASASVFVLVFSLSPQSPANQLLGFFHLGPWQWLRQPQGIFAGRSLPVFFTDWLTSWGQGPSLALICIMIFNTWLFSGYYALVFANGLASIPPEVYEAAALDGVSRPKLLTKIILPLLSPTTYFLTLLGVVGTFKAFSSIYVLRDASTAGAVDPSSVYIFFTFFRDVRYGYAAALAVVLFLIIFTVSNAQRLLWEKRVFYE